MTPNILEGKASPRRKANTIWELTRNPTRDKNGLPGVKPAGIPSGVSSSAIATAMRTFQGPTRKLPYSMAMDEALAEKFGRDKTNSDERAKCIRAQHPYDNVHRGVRGDLELIADIPLGHLFDLYLNMAPPPSSEDLIPTPIDWELLENSIYEAVVFLGLEFPDEATYLYGFWGRRIEIWRPNDPYLDSLGIGLEWVDGRLLAAPDTSDLRTWVDQQSAVAAVFERALEELAKLADNGILDNNFNVANADDIEDVLTHVECLGMISMYDLSPDENFATEMVGAYHSIASSIHDAEVHSRSVTAWGLRVDALLARVEAKNAEIAAYRIEGEILEQEREVRRLERRRDRTLVAEDSVTSHFESMARLGRGAQDVLSGGDDEGVWQILSGIVDLFSAQARSNAQHRYFIEIEAAKQRIRELVDLGVATGEDRLVAELEGLEAELTAVQGEYETLRDTAELRLESLKASMLNFGSTTALALEYTEWSSPLGALGVQRLFANQFYLESVRGLFSGIEWPCLDEGEDFPLSGWLLVSDSCMALERIAWEAWKLRWWKYRITGIVRLAERMSEAQQEMVDRPAGGDECRQSPVTGHR